MTLCSTRQEDDSKRRHRIPSVFGTWCAQHCRAAVWCVWLLEVPCVALSTALCVAQCAALCGTVCGYRRAADQRHVHLPDYSAPSCLLLPSSAESCVRQGSTLPPSPPPPPRCRLMLARDTGATRHCSSRAEYTVDVVNYTVYVGEYTV